MYKAMHVALFTKSAVGFVPADNDYLLMSGRLHEALLQLAGTPCSMCKNGAPQFILGARLSALARELGRVPSMLIIRDYRNTETAKGLDGGVWHERLRRAADTSTCSDKQSLNSESLWVYYDLCFTSAIASLGKMALLLKYAHPDLSSANFDNEERLTERLVGEVAVLTPYVPLRFECLVYASVLTRRLRLNGIDAYLVIGIRATPFEAHAWTRIGDRVIGEVPSVTKSLHVIFDGGIL